MGWSIGNLLDITGSKTAFDLGKGLFGGLGGKNSGGKQRIGQGSPAGGTLADLFGTRFNGKRGYLPIEGSNAPLSSGNISKSLNDYLYNPLLGQGEQDSLRGLFNGGGYSDIISRSMEGFRGLSDLGRMGAATGFRNDATPAYNEAIRLFKSDILPQIAETSGAGLQSTGFEALAGREASNLLGQASMQQLGMDEAASERMMSLLPIAGQLQAAEAQFPMNIADYFNNQNRQPFDAFLEASNRQSPLYQAGFPTTDKTSDKLSGLGAIIGGLSQFKPSM